MNIQLVASLSGSLLGLLMTFLSVFLIMLILIQRGKGGGLTGALGGPGGQSAFGSKAGDTFTWITVVVAAIWGFTCAFTMWLLGTHSAPVTKKTPDMQAAPTEGDDTTNNTIPFNPSGSGFGIGGGDGGAIGESPSMELTPAGTDDDQAGSDTESSESTDAGESTGDQGSAEAETTSAEETSTTEASPSTESAQPADNSGDSETEAESNSPGDDQTSDE